MPPPLGIARRVIPPFSPPSPLNQIHHAYCYLVIHTGMTRVEGRYSYNEKERGNKGSRGSRSMISRQQVHNRVRLLIQYVHRFFSFGIPWFSSSFCECWMAKYWCLALAHLVGCTVPLSVTLTVLRDHVLLYTGFRNSMDPLRLATVNVLLINQTTNKKISYRPSLSPG